MHQTNSKSLQFSIPLKGTNNFSKWNEFQVFAWLNQNQEKFDLEADDMDNIDDSHLTGAQLLSKTEDELSVEWVVSIHSVRKILAKANSLQNSTGIAFMADIDEKNQRRSSEPQALAASAISSLTIKKKVVISSSKVNFSPIVENIDDANYHSNRASIKRRKLSGSSVGSSNNSPGATFHSNRLFLPNVNEISNPSPMMNRSSMSRMSEIRNLRTKLKIKIKNDTYMARLSHPKWWMDGNFSHIPNKIRSKEMVEINISGAAENPCIGILCFTLSIDPRYASAQTQNNNKYSFSPWILNNPSQVNMLPNMPSWMIGPGGVPYLPPSLEKLYDIQQQYIQKITEKEDRKQEKIQLIERRILKKKENLYRKEKRLEEKRQQKQRVKKARKLEKRHKKIELLKQQSLKTEEKESTSMEETKSDVVTDSTANNDMKIGTQLEPIKITDIVLKLNISDEDEDDDDEESEEVTESVSEDDDESSQDEEEDDNKEEDDEDIQMDDIPKFRLLFVWSISRVKSDRRSSELMRNSIISVASSDLLHGMNRFNVLLLEDDTDCNEDEDEFILDNTYFTELENTSLIADLEQCLVKHELFEISATFGCSSITNEYEFCIDIDDALGDWPSPLASLNAQNPFSLGFVPPMNSMAAAMTMQRMMSTGNNYQRSAKRLNIPSSPVRQPHSKKGTFTLSDVVNVARSPRKATLRSSLSERIASPAYSSRRRANSQKQKAPRLSLWKEQMQYMHNSSHSQNPPVSNSSLQSGHPQLATIPSSHSVSTDRQSTTFAVVSPREPQHKLHLQIIKSEPPPMGLKKEVEYNICDRVLVDGGKLGQIKSIGQQPQWGAGTFYGIRLAGKNGACDGSWKGIRCFSCPPGYGVFVKKQRITQKLPDAEFDFMDLWRKYYAKNLMKPLQKKQFIALSRGPGVGLTTTEASEIFYKLDVNKSGSINYAQIHALTHNIERSAKSNDEKVDDSSDEDPGVSDIPVPGSFHLLKHSTSERILSLTPKSNRVSPSFDNKPNKSSKPPSSKPPSSKSKINVNKGWTGGAPRTIVLRNKILPIKLHAGYKSCQEGMKLREEEKYKFAIEKFKIGIALLQVTLLDIDRGLEKRKWRAVIEEFRHKMSRCTFEIQNSKRNRFLKKRNENIRKQAEMKAKLELEHQKKAMQEALSNAVGRERNWTVTREDMEVKLQANRELNAQDADSDEPSSKKNNKKHMRDQTLAKTKRDYRLKKKGKGKKDWRDYPGYGGEMGDSAGEDGSEDGSDDDNGKDDGKKKKKTKLSKHDQELRSRIEGDVMTEAPDVSFSDVVGLENVKLALYESIILPFLRPDLFQSIKKSTQGILLFGPPGNGKTMIAKCVAAQCDCTFFSISASSITSKFVGEAERIMRTLFDMARQRSPSIIFIDEIDSLLRARGGANEAESSRRIKTEFLIQFDGVKSAEQADTTITVIGATNLPSQLDDAVLRRFPKRILVPNPDSVARYGLVRLLMRKQNHAMTEKHFQSVSTQLNGYSCSDIAMLCTDAKMGPIRSIKGADILTTRKSQIPPISMKHFQQSIKNIRSSLSEEAVNAYRAWNDEFGSKLFLTMDVLPKEMLARPLLSVKEERAEKKRKIKEEMEKIIALADEQKQQKLLKQKGKEKNISHKKNTSSIASKQSSSESKMKSSANKAPKSTVSSNKKKSKSGSPVVNSSAPSATNSTVQSKAAKRSSIKRKSTSNVDSNANQMKKSTSVSNAGKRKKSSFHLTVTSSKVELSKRRKSASK